jgi:transglutaminase-like putative cysteine protease
MTQSAIKSMLISIRHTTQYHYDGPVQHAVQALRLTPPSGLSQQVRHWSIHIPGFEGASQFTDAFGNFVHLVTPPGPVTFVPYTHPGSLTIGARVGSTVFDSLIHPPMFGNGLIVSYRVKRFNRRAAATPRTPVPPAACNSADCRTGSTDRPATGRGR